MRRNLCWCGLALLLVAPVHADTPKPKAVKEYWEATFLKGAQIGHTHRTIEVVERDGKKLQMTSIEVEMVIKRYGAVTTQRYQSGDEATADGVVREVSFTLLFDKGKLALTGKVEGDKLIVSGTPDGKTHTVPWNSKVVSLARQDRLFADRKVKPGDSFEFLTYEFAVMRVIPIKAVVKDYEEVEVLEPKKVGDKLEVGRVKQKLLRVEATPDKIEIDGRPLPLPRQVLWLDKNLEAVRTETEIPGLGKFTSYRTTKEVAQRKIAAPELLPDLGLDNVILLEKPLERPLTSKSAIYRITIPGEDDPGTTFSSDGRQTVKNVKGESFELHIKGQRGPVVVEKPEKVKDEFTKSSFYVDSDNAKIKALATKTIGTETSPWAQARLLEKWVHDNMKVDSATDFMPASRIAGELKGDCRQHAILTAALCRAAGVPSRTALGLVYARLDGKPLLGFHMWTEVLVKGQWLGLDAMLGEGGVGVGHLKITDSSWVGTQALSPTLPVLRVIGRAKVEILKEE